MRVANIRGRLALLTEGGAVDVATASQGRFGPDPQSVWADWNRFVEWASAQQQRGATTYLSEDVGAPVPCPRQIFAVGVNYQNHAAEASVDLPARPMVFTKFPSCLTGPYGAVSLPSDHCDWEVELVAVIGAECTHVPIDDGWSVVAGLTVGQDLSERIVQMQPPLPQFSLGKSFPGFGPIGPAVVTPDQLADPNDLAIGCRVNGEDMQKARTSELIFGVAELVSYLSGIVTLYPGDLIFTGSPAGIGFSRTPPVALQPGDELESYIEGLGMMRHVMRGTTARSD